MLMPHVYFNMYLIETPLTILNNYIDFTLYKTINTSIIYANVMFIV